MTQKAEILDWLQHGHSLTQMECTERFKCTRLAARVYDLTLDGHNIKSRMIGGGNGKHWAEYFIPRPTQFLANSSGQLTWLEEVRA